MPHFRLLTIVAHTGLIILPRFRRNFPDWSRCESWRHLPGRVVAVPSFRSFGPAFIGAERAFPGKLRAEELRFRLARDPALSPDASRY